MDESGGEKPNRDAQPAHLRRPRLRRVPATEYLLWKHGIVRAPATLAKLACIGGGPRFVLVGGRIPYYPIEELDEWALQLLGPIVSSPSYSLHGRDSLAGMVQTSGIT
jgi:hypothetical protein